MAFGDPRGAADLELSGASVGATNDLTGSNPVVVGDLVLVCFAQQTALTASGVTDNLGNTYTAANAGTDGGVITGRFFYSRVTVAGTLTTVTVAATASANDFAGCARAIEGPFDASNLISGTTPANTSVDLTSPFDCPSSGTLDTLTPDNLKRLVVGWAAHDNNAGWSAGNGTEVAEVNRANANAIISVQTTTSTSAVAPQFTGTNPAAIVLGTISFNEAFVAVTQQPLSTPTRRKGLAAAVIAAGLSWSGHTPEPVEPPEEATIAFAQADATVPYQRTVLYPSHFGPPSAVPVNPDWFSPLSEPVRRTVDVSRQPAVFYFPYVEAAPGTPGNDEPKVTSNEMLVPYVRSFLYQSYFDGYYPPDVVVNVFPDSWHVPLSEPVRRKPLTEAGPTWTPQPIAGDTTVDEWHRPLSEPVRRKVSVASQPSLAWTPQPIAGDTTVDEWYQPLSEPVRRTVRRTSHSYFDGYYPAEVVVNVFPDSWYTPLAEPVRRKPPTEAGPTWAPQPIADDTTVDEWHRPLSEPVRRKISVANQPSVSWTPQPIAGDTTIDEWFSPLSEPVRAKRKTHTQPTWTPYPFVAGPDSWQRPLSEPTRRKVSVANQPSVSWAPQPIAGDTRVDEWFRPLSEPVRRKVNRRSEYVAYSYYTEFIIEEVTLDKWYRPLNEPPRRKNREPHTYYAYVALAHYAGNNDTTIDEWHRPFSEPRRFRRSVPTSLLAGQTWTPDPQLFWQSFTASIEVRWRKTLLYTAIHQPVEFRRVIGDITSTEILQLPVDVVLHGEQVQYKTSNYSNIPPTEVSSAPKIPKSKVRRLKGKLPTFTTKTDKRGYD